MNLFISQAYLNKKSIIPSNIDWSLIEPMLEVVQQSYILPLLGSDFYDELVTQSTPPTSLTAANKTLLDNYILPCMVQYFLVHATPLFKFRYTNKGVMEKNSENSTQISTDDLKYLVDEHKNMAELYARNLVRYIKIKGVSVYPTYFTVSTTTLITPQQEAFDCGLFLPDGQDSIKPYPNWGDTK